MNKLLLSIVIPVFNEEESIGETFARLNAFCKKMNPELNSELIFVDDGSKDLSFSLLSDLAKAHQHVKVVRLSRNFGHQFAVTAGIDLSDGDYVALIDADLQDPPELLEDMYRIAITGIDVVYGRRKTRAGESLFKKITAFLFYKFLNYMCDIEIPRDTGDFRLMSRRVVNEFKLMRERHRFVRGMIPWLGFSSLPFYYDRAERFSGTTKYPFKKMLQFATNAILSFSAKPLTLTIRIGLLTMLVGGLYGARLLYLKLFYDIFIPGFAAVILTIIFFGGVNIFLMGIVGEYISKIFEEIKGRPLYVIDKTINI